MSAEVSPSSLLSCERQHNDLPEVMSSARHFRLITSTQGHCKNNMPFCRPLTLSVTLPGDLDLRYLKVGQRSAILCGLTGSFVLVLGIRVSTKDNIKVDRLWG